MPDLEKLLGLTFDKVEQTIEPKDAMLYALGIGMGDVPTDPQQLQYLYERELKIFPTMAITLCYPKHTQKFAERTGLNPDKNLHVYQRFKLLRPIPLGRPLVGKNRIVDVFDKGPGRGVLWTYQNEIRDKADGALICLLEGASMCMGAGGTGWKSKGTAPTLREFPRSPPDATIDFQVLPQAALIYRLSGDYNPIHIDPERARKAGFDQPILHGRCTFGIAGRAVLEALGAKGLGLRAMEARFTKPVIPGELLRTDIWMAKHTAMFRVRVPARDAVVLDRGFVELA